MDTSAFGAYVLNIMIAIPCESEIDLQTQNIGNIQGELNTNAL